MVAGEQLIAKVEVVDFESFKSTDNVKIVTTAMAEAGKATEALLRATTGGTKMYKDERKALFDTVLRTSVDGAELVGMSYLHKVAKELRG